MGETTIKRGRAAGERRPILQSTDDVFELVAKLGLFFFLIYWQLCHLQAWVKSAGARIIIVFEGRDAAGKGGTIRAMTERVSPRVFRVVALPAPSDREKT